jgi:hypothetical protein
MAVAIDRRTFDHVCLITDVEQPGESWVEATRVWVTSPRAHPYNIEYLRFSPDSTLTGPVREQPHVAYRVPDLDAAIEDHELLLGPFEVGEGFLRVAFALVAGVVVEFMQYRDPNEEGWF